MRLLLVREATGPPRIGEGSVIALLHWWSVYVGLMAGGAVGIFVGIWVGFTANIKLKERDHA